MTSLNNDNSSVGTPSGANNSETNNDDNDTNNTNINVNNNNNNNNSNKNNKNNGSKSKSTPTTIKSLQLDIIQNDDDDANATSDNDRAIKIKKLKAKLINEEHRLVLMKKIRQSQTRPTNQQQQQQQSQQQPVKHATSSSSSSSQAVNVASSQLLNNNHTTNPAKKLRPNLPANSINASNLSGNLLTNKINPDNLVAPGTSSMNQTPAHAHQRTKNNTLWNQPMQMRQPTPAGIAPPHVGNLSRNPITTPPNVVQAMIGSLNANQQSLLMNQINALTAAAANTGANSLLGTTAPPPPGKASRRSGASNLLRQPITTPPNVIQSATLTPGNQQSSNRRAHSSSSSTPRNNQQQQQPLTSAPNVLQDIRGALSGQQQSLLMNANNILAAQSSGRTSARSQQSSLSLTPQQSQQQQQQQSPFNKSQAAQLLVQRRTTAKQAVQKQLEQTLMQLPQKHIQVGIDFVPNANNVEFVCYIGLEACVDYLTDSKNPMDTQPLEKPYECSTCGTDFTPSWSWKRSNPVCENCVGNHVKKSIKNSQSSRIKSVLVKAAKQEQEIDQKIMAEAANVVTSPSTPATSSGGSNQRHSSLLQPASQSTPRASAVQQQQQQQTPNWPRVSQSPITMNRSSASSTSGAAAAPLATTMSNALPATNILPNLNLSNPLAALGSLPPAALASLLHMNPQFSTLASLMAGNSAAPAPPPPPPPPPPPVSSSNNTNQIAQVAALLMNQLTANLWNKR